MKNERITVIAGLVCLFALIIAVIVVTIFYMSDEPAWNRLPAVTEAPTLEIVTKNMPPGRG